jgi:hypothetical protein
MTEPKGRIRVCAADDIKPGEILGVEISGLPKLAIYRVGDEFYCTRTSARTARVAERRGRPVGIRDRVHLARRQVRHPHRQAVRPALHRSTAHVSGVGRRGEVFIVVE